MLLEVGNLFKRLGLDAGTVIHVGAHEAEERDFYMSLNLSPRLWIEAQPELVSKLITRLAPPQDQVIEGAVWSESGLSISLNISSNSQSSSVLELGSHSAHYPGITYVGTVEVKSIVLGDILSNMERVTLLTLDIQGAELQALKGAGDHVAKVEAIYVEVNFEEVYKECALIGEIDSYLNVYGFKRVLTFRTQAGWGDSLYLKQRVPIRLAPILWIQRGGLRWRYLVAWSITKLGSVRAVKAIMRTIRRQN